MSDLTTEVKELIIDSLDLEDTAPNDIETDAELFGDGLGLDSIDALELGLSIYKKYDVKLDASSEDSRQHFQSVATLVSFISSKISM
jgi:acyl carrier protein|tara:strand:+ start:1213 stop:1473 length:261 start_codon:yes stop_codon:yes gene_type:complete